MLQSQVRQLNLLLLLARLKRLLLRKAQKKATRILPGMKTALLKQNRKSWIQTIPDQQAAVKAAVPVLPAINRQRHQRQNRLKTSVQEAATQLPQRQHLFLLQHPHRFRQPHRLRNLPLHQHLNLFGAGKMQRER